MGILTDNPWLDETTRSDELKTLSATELSVLRRFLRDAYEIMQSDVEGVTLELEDGLFASAEILGILLVPDVEEDDLA